MLDTNDMIGERGDSLKVTS